MLTITALLIAFSPNLWAQTPQYTVTNLGNVFGSSLNDRGQVVGGIPRGFIGSEPVYHPFIWDSVNGVQDLGLPPGYESAYAYSVNSLGHVAGVANNYSDGVVQLFFWSAKSGFLVPGVQSLIEEYGYGAYVMTEMDEILGTMLSTLGSSEQAFFWSPTNGNATFTLPPPSSCLTPNVDYSTAVSPNGQWVVGGVACNLNSHNPTFNYSFWTGGTWTALADPVLQPDNDGIIGVWGVNDSGQVVGNVLDASGVEHATLWTNNVPMYLGTLSGDTSATATDINDSSQVVGCSGTGGKYCRPFVWDATNGMQDLSTFLPAGSQVGNISTISINNAGQIIVLANVVTSSGLSGDTFLLSPASCQVALSPSFVISSSPSNIPGYIDQADSPWGSYPLGNSTEETIAGGGCILTAVTMGINTADPDGEVTLSPPRVQLAPYPTPFVNPESLDSFLVSYHDQDFDGPNMLVDDSIRDASSAGLVLRPLPGGPKTSITDPSATTQLSQALCQNNLPVLVGVNLSPNEKGTGYNAGHWVLVTGVSTAQDGTQTFTIADPGHRSYTSLAGQPYNGEFQTRGVITTTTNSASGLDVYTDNNADLIVTDPGTNQTGIDPTSGVLLQNIANSAYFGDSLDNATTGEVVPGFTLHTVQMFQPVAGMYSITVSGIATGPYLLTVSPWSVSGQSEGSLTAQGNISAPGASATYSVTYDPTGATSPTLLASTATNLAVSLNPSFAGSTVTFTATVATPSSNAPTGTVQFSDGGATLGSSAIIAGVAVYSTMSLAAGQHSITASYGGDSNNSASVSVALIETVNPARFSLSVNPGSISVGTGTGQSAATTVTTTPEGSFGTRIDFSCSGFPPGVSCTFSPASVTPNAAIATTTLTIQVSDQAALGPVQFTGQRSPFYGIWIMVPALLVGSLGTITRKHRTAMGSPLAFLLLVSACLLLVSCGGRNSSGGGGSTPTTYTVTVIGTAGSIQNSTNISLIIQ
jgi:probable HAF family extracellular repeat protein